MNERCKKIGKVAMAVALSDVINPKHEKSRMYNLCKRLKKKSEFKLSFMVATPEEKKNIMGKIETFKSLVGWDKNQKRIETYAAFVLTLLDKENNVSGIIEAINDICNFLNQAEMAPTPCDWSGALAYNKWEEVWGED